MRLPVVELGALLLATTSAAAAAEQPQPQADLDLVLHRAKLLLNGTFNAGGSYADVWARDTATFIAIATSVNTEEICQKTLLGFLKWQKTDGELPGGYSPSKPKTPCASPLCDAVLLLGARIQVVRPRTQVECGQPARVLWHIPCALTACRSTMPHPFGRRSHGTQAFPACLGGTPVCKNDAETDQECSVVQAVRRYYDAAGAAVGAPFLQLEVDGVSVLGRLELALDWLLQWRLDPATNLLCAFAIVM